MRNIETWKPTKYIIRKGKLRANSNVKEVGIGSRLIAQLIVSSYEKNIPKYVKGCMADIGCGFVPLYAYYSPYVDNVTTIDWAASFHANEHLDIIADLNKAPIVGVKNNSFDTIICSDVLEHIYEYKSLLCEMYRIMKPGGYMLLNVPFYYWIHEIPYDYHRYTEWALKQSMNDTGFEIVEIQSLGGVVAAWIDITSKCFGGMGIIGRIFARLLQYVAVLLLKSKKGRAILSYKGNVFPLGYFLIVRKNKDK